METTKEKKYLIIAATILLALLSIGLIAKIAMGFRGGDRHYGNNSTTPTITLSGKGEVTAVPDIAVITFTARENAKTAKDAEGVVSGKVTKALQAIKDAGVDDKDVKTEGYNSYPQYAYGTPRCYATYCPQNQTISGYETTQTVTVKVRKVDDAGKIISAITSSGINEVSGPDFQIDNEDALVSQARQKAIDDAKGKAKELARQLGVRLGKVTSFQENGGSPVPIYADAQAMGANATAKSAPNLPQGENKITSNVTITYEIR